MLRLLTRAVDWCLWALLHTRARYRCGHLDERRLYVWLWGHDLGVKSDPGLRRERCGRCEVTHLEAVSIRCAASECGRPILTGDAICVVIPTSLGGGSWRPAPWSRWISESVVICSSCGFGSDYSGNWGYGRYSPQSLRVIDGASRSLGSGR